MDRRFIATRNGNSCGALFLATMVTSTLGFAVLGPVLRAPEYLLHVYSNKTQVTFQTHRFIEIDLSRVEFKASTVAKIFYAFFAVVGICAAALSSIKFTPFEDFTFEGFMPVIFGIVFALAGALMVYFGTAPIVFDKQVGYFWNGRKSSQNSYDTTSIKKIAPLGDIHAIQLISEYVRSSKSSYYSYELNLVLNDGKRMNVVDHGNLAKLREDAKKLSEFLGKPVWDAIYLSDQD